jgi:hypothetical protein
MARLLKTITLQAAVCMCLALTQAQAYDLDLSIDLRAVNSTATQSRLTGGLGATRFAAGDNGLQLGLVRLAYRGDLTDTVQFTTEAVSYGERSKPIIDVTEAYLDWRPIPASAWRSQFKLGAFYPEISLENRLRGWRSPYTLSSSAINSWLGEELRTIGAQYALDWLGQKSGHAVDVGISVAAFGWNDPAGTVIATRGWGLHDQQTGLFGAFGKPGQQPLPERTLIYDDMDQRAGYHVATNLNYRGLVELTAMHYDNRADPAIYSATIDDVAWLTHFNSLGVRLTPSDSLTLIWQRLYGRTYAGDDPKPNCWTFGSWFGLLSWKSDANRYSARYDQFAMNQMISNYGFYNWQQGHALTLAYGRQLNSHWNLMLEGLQTDSTLRSRSSIGQPKTLRERQLQLALRYEL